MARAGLLLLAVAMMAASAASLGDDSTPAVAAAEQKPDELATAIEAQAAERAAAAGTAVGVLPVEEQQTAFKSAQLTQATMDLLKGLQQATHNDIAEVTASITREFAMHAAALRKLDAEGGEGKHAAEAVKKAVVATAHAAGEAAAKAAATAADKKKKTPAAAAPKAAEKKAAAPAEKKAPAAAPKAHAFLELSSGARLRGAAAVPRAQGASALETLSAINAELERDLADLRQEARSGAGGEAAAAERQAAFDELRNEQAQLRGLQDEIAAQPADVQRRFAQMAMDDAAPPAAAAPVAKAVAAAAPATAAAAKTAAKTATAAAAKTVAAAAAPVAAAAAKVVAKADEHVAGAKRAAAKAATAGHRSLRKLRGGTVRLNPYPGQLEPAITIRSRFQQKPAEMPLIKNAAAMHTWVENQKEIVHAIDNAQATIKQLRVHIVGKENFLSSLQTREAAIKEDIAKDKTTKTQLEAHVKALTARVHLLQKHRLAMELRAQQQQYAAAQHTLEGQANSIKQVANSLSSRVAAVETETKPLQAEESKEMAESLGVGLKAHESEKGHSHGAGHEAKGGAAAKAAAPAKGAAAAPAAAAPAAAAAAPAAAAPAEGAAAEAEPPA